MHRRIHTMTGIISRLFCLFLKVSGTGSFPPPLSHAKERECFIKARGGDREAREALIEHNLRLVAHIVKKYYPTCRNQDDLVSIGTVGLIKAIDSFDITNGARFATYASRCLQNEILMYFRSQKKTACEVSINETIDIDKVQSPDLHRRYKLRGHHRRGYRSAAEQQKGDRPDKHRAHRQRAADNRPALRAEQPEAGHTARDRRRLRNIPFLRQPHRKKRNRQAERRLR